MRYSPTASTAAVAALLIWSSGCSGSTTAGESSKPEVATTTSPVSTAAATAASAASTASAPPTGPCGPVDTTTYGGAAFASPKAVLSANRVLSTTLTVKYGDNEIAGCSVHLRSYNGQLVGDTLRAKPGDTLDIQVENTLPATNVDGSNADYNITNLHTHGLHTDPTGVPDAWGDNVLLRIWPQGAAPPKGDHEGMTDVVGTAHYQIQIPKDHTAGTFWYHSHAHGSTAVQVSSGMAGALIIEGGIDEIPSVKAAKEEVFVFQQNVYDANGLIEQPEFGQFGPCTWEPSGRTHLINGQLFPTLTMSTDEVQRWRLIHGGIRETVSVELRGPDDGRLDKLSLPLVDLNEIAVDGIPTGRLDAWKQVTLNPGYRSDVLVNPQAPGTYYLFDGVSGDNALTCPGTIEEPSMLATVIVQDTVLTMELPTAEELAEAAAQPNGKPDDLVSIDGSQAPNTDGFLVPKGTINNLQRVDFSIARHPSKVPHAPVEFFAADHQFDAMNARRLNLNDTDLWMVTTTDDSLYYAHPFHIHVNPFQTWRDGPDRKPQLIWRDTILAPQGVTQYLYTKYTDYWGDYVYHCHILDHEDQGMMERVSIAQPSG